MPRNYFPQNFFGNLGLGQENIFTCSTLTNEKMKILGILIIVVALVCSCSTMTCKESLSSSLNENTIYAEVEKCLLDKDNLKIDSELATYLMKKGFFRVIDNLLKNYFLRESIDISKELKEAAQENKNRLDKIVNMISHVKKPLK